MSFEPEPMKVVELIWEDGQVRVFCNDQFLVVRNYDSLIRYRESGGNMIVTFSLDQAHPDYHKGVFVLRLELSGKELQSLANFLLFCK